MQRHDGHKDTVKRHLDSQHLEYALNEVSSSTILSSVDMTKFRTDLSYQWHSFGFCSPLWRSSVC
jgi:hypothetical protein